MSKLRISARWVVSVGGIDGGFGCWGIAAFVVIVLLLGGIDICAFVMGIISGCACSTASIDSDSLIVMPDELRWRLRCILMW